VRRFVPTPPRRPEGIRWLRSDGKPNISDRIYRVEGDAQIIATRPVYTIAKTSPVLEAAETIAYKWVRALPVVNPGDHVYCLSSGGGGYGNPSERSKEAEEWDRRNGYVG